MAQDIVVRYRAELDEALRKLEDFAKAIEDTSKGSAQAQGNLNKTAVAADKLGDEVAQTSKQIKDSTKNVDDFSKKATSTFNGLGRSVSSFAAAAAGALGVAFSVDAVIQFGKASVNAFLEAERNAERLRFAITTIGGESEAAFERLIRQSSQLQEITVFDDDSIQAAQAALSAFGLTANEIERTIPLLADFATVTGVDLPTAAQQLGAGLEGAGREFKKYGIEVSATASRQDNLNNILNGFTRFAGSAEAATGTLSGQLQQLNNRAADLQESIGSKLAPAFLQFKVDLLELVQGFTDLPKVAAKAIEDLINSLTGGKGATTAATNSYVDFEDQIVKTINAVQTLSELETVTNKLRVDQTKNIANQQATIDRLLERAAKIRESENGNINEAIALEQGAAKLRETNLQNEINKLNIIERIYNERLTAINKTAKVEKKASDERIAGSDKEVQKIQTLTAQYRDLLALQNLTPEQRQIFELALETGDIEQFKIELAKLSAELKLEVPLTLTIPENRKDLGLKEPIDNSRQQLDQFVKEAQEVIAGTQQIVNELTNIYNTYYNGQIEQINRVRDAQLESLDLQLQANEDALERRQISEADAEENRRRLIRQREEAEATAARKERELRRKQAQANKAAALAQATINVAEAITKALTAGPIIAQVLAGITAALGAVQLGIIASQPIPYKRGSKNTKGGLSRVGEEGEEILYIPQGAKVLPNKQTNRYGEVLDAMFDNRFDGYIQQKYIAPALMKEKSNRAIADRASFADNIIKSATMNGQSTGLDYYGMRNALSKGTAINDVSPEAADAIAKAMAKYISTNPFRY